MSILLNGFKIEFSESIFTAYEQPMPNSAMLKPLREKLQAEWFLHWRHGKAFGIPRIPNPTNKFGVPVQLASQEHLSLLKARVDDVLPEVFDCYTPFRRKPFTFLAQKRELVSEILQYLSNPPDLVSAFKIVPKYALEARTIELRHGEVELGLFLKLQTRWQIGASLSDLQQAGIDLQGLYIVRRQPEPGQRRLVGRIEQLSGQTVELSESFEPHINEIAMDDVWLEGSKANFTHCLKTLLGEQYQRFESQRAEQEAKLLTGPAIEQTLEQLQAFLRQKSPLQLAPDLQGKIGDRIRAVNDAAYQSITTAAPVEYCFDPARTKRSLLPWVGISQYGPFSRDVFSKKSSLEIMVLYPNTVQGAVEKFLRAFGDGISLTKRTIRDGVEQWEETSRYPRGFANLFGLINLKITHVSMPWLSQTQIRPANAYAEAVKRFLKNRETMPDAAIVVIPNEYANLPNADSPYLQTKALLLMAGIPVQEIRVSTLRQPPEALQFTLQSFSLALYAKLSGSPWTVDHDLTIHDELVIGVGTCELSGSRFAERQRFVGITTVFRGDGNYLLGHLSDECSYEEYAAVLKKTMLSILQEIKERNAWQPGDTIRLIFHAAKPLKNVEVASIIAECVAEAGAEHNIEFAFLTVSQDHPFSLLDKSQLGSLTKAKTRKGVYVPERGTIVQLGRYTRLLCTNGPALIKRAFSPLPIPLLIHLHPQSTYCDLTYLSEQVLKFTSLSWKSLLPVGKPVTIYYSELIAELLARLRTIRDWSPAMLNLRLRASKWFL